MKNNQSQYSVRAKQSICLSNTLPSNTPNKHFVLQLSFSVKNIGFLTYLFETCLLSKPNFYYATLLTGIAIFSNMH